MVVIVRRAVVTFALCLIAIPAWAQGPALQGFSVVLVLGDLQDGATSDNIPPAARAASPISRTSCRIGVIACLDSAWVLASSATRQAVSSRLQGPDEQDYLVTLDRGPVGPRHSRSDSR